jgi:predicted GNAT family N-acyltransferase
MDVKIADYHKFNEEIRMIRENVFIKEQNIPKNIEFDGLDAKAKHVIVFDNKEAIGTGRILPDGHIGRIAVKKSYRGKGIGAIIMKKLINAAENLYLDEVWLSSQYHAKDFYLKLGFEEFRGIFQEAGINHIRMKKTVKQKYSTTDFIMKVHRHTRQKKSDNIK